LVRDGGWGFGGHLEGQTAIWGASHIVRFSGILAQYYTQNSQQAYKTRGQMPLKLLTQIELYLQFSRQLS
jgi:hypothetical protein